MYLACTGKLMTNFGLSRWYERCIFGKLPSQEFSLGCLGRSKRGFGSFPGPLDCQPTLENIDNIEVGSRNPRGKK